MDLSKLFRAVINSSISNRMQAAIDIKVETNANSGLDKSYSKIKESIGDSRVK